MNLRSKLVTLSLGAVAVMGLVVAGIVGKKRIREQRHQLAATVR